MAEEQTHWTELQFGSMELSPGGERFTMTNMPLGALLLVAYDITVRQLSGAPDAIAEHYDIAAEAEHRVSRDEMLQMIQALWADRFKPVLRRESKSCRGAESNGQVIFTNESMPDFAWALARMTGIGDRVVAAAAREQLGLKLETERAPVEFFVIEHIGKPSENRIILGPIGSGYASLRRRKAGMSREPWTTATIAMGRGSGL
jgi:hypothetical protein